MREPGLVEGLTAAMETSPEGLVDDNGRVGRLHFCEAAMETSPEGLVDGLRRRR